MKRLNYSLLTGLFFALAGTSLLAWGTNGFAAFTSESARRLMIAKEAPPVPDVVLQNQDGRRFRISDLHGRLLVVEFIYTTCPTLCSALGIAFQRIRDSLPADLPGREVVLLSVSFNPDVDTPKRLTDYANRYQAKSTAWHVARVQDRQQLQTLLETFGVVVIANEYGGFEHNAAIHIVDRNGHLVSIEDLEQASAIAMKLQARL